MNSLKFFLLILLFQTISVNAQNKSDYRFDVNKVDKNLARITDSLYAYKYECSNYEYRIFLRDLRDQGRLEEYQKYEVDSAQWRCPATFNEPYVMYYDTFPAYHNYPVVNITHASANAYRKWLTEKYNSDKKRKYKKVIFKLPSEYEWKLAANEGNKYIKKYPVSGLGYSLTSKGKPLCNYLKLDEGCFIKDSTGRIIYGCYPNPIQHYGPEGGFYTSAVDGCEPLKNGLYNMAGNVAEMLDMPGRTKGGSFQSVAGYLQINSPDEYKGFTHGQPQIGFRVFMLVVEK